MRILLIALAFVMGSLSNVEGVCSLTAPVILSAYVDDYYQESSWPTLVEAASNQPWPPGGLPEYYTSFDGFSVIIDNGAITDWTTSERVTSDGCYYKSWSSGTPDNPYHPLWCVSDPTWSTYCRDVGRPKRGASGETVKIEVSDNSGHGATVFFQVSTTTRGSQGVYP